METLPGGYTPGLWAYDTRDKDNLRPFGDETTYRMGLGWLYDKCQTVQDWGAGVAYGRRFCPPGKSYLAIDGSPTSASFVDVLSELTAWRPDPLPDGIFMRHILEHNRNNWADILDHALESFTLRFCLVIFTPFTSGETAPLRPPGDLYTDLAFNYTDLTDRLEGYRWNVVALPTETQYGSETLFFIQRPK